MLLDGGDQTMPQLLGLKPLKVSLASAINLSKVMTMAKKNPRRYPAGRNLNNVAYEMKLDPQQAISLLKPLGKDYLFKKGPWWFVSELGIAKLKLEDWNKAMAPEKMDKAPIPAIPEQIEPQEVSNEEQTVEQSHIYRTELDKLLANEETAMVLHARYPNKNIILVEYKGKKELCKVKDSAFYQPMMKIAVRRDGVQLVSKYHPKRPGHL